MRSTASLIANWVVILSWVGGAVVAALGLDNLRRARRFGLAPQPRQKNSEDQPGVTVVIPTKGVDEGAAGNVRAWLSQAYRGRLEVIYSLQDPDDPALPVIRAAIANGSHVAEARVVVNPIRPGLSGKSSNLWHGVRQARFDRLVLADSDVRPDPDLVDRLTKPLSDGAVGLVSALPEAVGPRGLWGGLLSASFNLALAGLWSSMLRMGLVLGAPGACVALRRDVLVRIGGIEAFGGFVAEDAMLGLAVHRAGYRIRVGPAVRLLVGASTFGNVYGLYRRGGFMFRYLTPPALTLASLTLAYYPMALGLWSAVAWLGWLPGAPALWLRTAGLVWLGRVGALAWLMRSIDPRAVGWAASLPLAEGLQLMAHLHAFVSNRITWRGVRYRVAPGGRLVAD